jgi:hypothetical protein
MPKRDVEGHSAGLIAKAREAARLIRTLGRADATALEPIVAAVLAETARNRFPAATLLAGLTAEYEDARAAVAGLVADARWHVRKRAIRCLDRNTPQAFSVEVLRSALADENAEVMLKAASWAGYLGLEAALYLELGSAYFNMGVLEYQRSNFPIAEWFCQCALEFQQKTLNETDPRVIDTLGALARISAQRRNKEEARENLARANANRSII